MQWEGVEVDRRRNTGMSNCRSSNGMTVEYNDKWPLNNCKGLVKLSPKLGIFLW